MVLIKKVVKYLLANPFYAAVVIVCGIAILAVIIAIFVKASKAKKSTDTPTPQTQPTTSNPVESSILLATEEIEEVSTPTQSVENNVAETSQSSEIKSEMPNDELANSFETKSQRQEFATKVKAETSSTQEVSFTPIQDVKEENPIEIVEEITLEPATQTTNEVETKKTTRYNGKWLIWRLLTKANDSDTVTEESYFFELVASNGEKLLSSEEYTSFAGAQKGIQTHKSNILKNNFRISLTKKGDYIFKLLSGKNSLLCTGENYPTKLRCENAVESTKRFAETAIIDENVHDLIIHIPAEDTDDPVIEHDNGYNGKWIVSTMLAPDGDQIFYFELFASNGEKLLSSEEYATYNGVINGINTHKSNIERNNFRISLTKRGDYIFKVLNANDQLLCLGEHYKTRRRCENAVESVKRFAKTAPIMLSPNIKQNSQGQ